MSQHPPQRSIDRHQYQTLPRHPLIICASLVQNPANLGGLCRTVEAFRLQSLVLSDLAVVQTPVFRNLAASSQYWQPLQACSMSQLPQWLAAQEAAIIGLDANPEARSLWEFTFPSRSVLLLGQELTGIPSALIQLCHHTVTIPQFGMVESFNVQTAAAIAIYEYIRQLHSTTALSDFVR